jgi:hypothetical protein
MVGLDPVVGVLVGAMPCKWQLLHYLPPGDTGARSVVTSAGLTLVVPMARSKHCRAAVASRRGATNTSMTCPNWSIAR